MVECFHSDGVLWDARWIIIIPPSGHLVAEFPVCARPDCLGSLGIASTWSRIDRGVVQTVLWQDPKIIFCMYLVWPLECVDS
jgi:hypothetical protein